MTRTFKLLMLGAMYENGGNTTHRFLDGHPQMFVYPFESQTGTKYVLDQFSSMFPLKYRWPTFALEATPYQDYKSIIDEECKVRARTPNSSKFKSYKFEFSDDERCALYLEYIKVTGRSRANNMAAFFQATFDAWKDYGRTGKEVFHVGYSPAIAIDAEKILTDMPESHFLHVVRNPWSAYADTKKRAVPLSLEAYMTAWNLNQFYALLNKNRFPERMHIIRAEDVMSDSYKTLGGLCEKLGLEAAETLKTPTWNGQPLAEVYPWGTIRNPTPAANKATAEELSKQEREEILLMTRHYVEYFDYKTFI